MTMSDVAAIYQERTGCDPQYGNDDSNEVWGAVDVWEIEQRCEPLPLEPTDGND